MRTNSYPAWFYGPNAAAQVFQSETDVPDGWADHPSKVVTAAATGSVPAPVVTDKVPEADRGSAPLPAGNDASAADTGSNPALLETGDVSNTLDADGWPWTEELHAATKSKTQANLWRMKVGVARPDPKPGFPVVLDL